MKSTSISQLKAPLREAEVSTNEPESPSKPLLKSDFDDLANWCRATGDIIPELKDVSALDRVQREDPTRANAMAALSRVSRFQRLSQLTTSINSVDGELQKRLNKMGTRNVLEYRKQLSADEQKLENFFLGVETTKGPGTNVQVNVAQMSAPLTSTPVESATNSGHPLSVLSRRKVAQMAQKLLQQANAKKDEVVDVESKEVVASPDVH